MRNTLGILVLAVLAATGCGRGRANAERGPKPVKAKVLTVEHKQLRRDVESVGSLFAYEEVTVSSEVEGKVERVLTDIGDRVGKGQPLVQVMPVELELSLEQQRGAYRQTAPASGSRTAGRTSRT